MNQTVKAYDEYFQTYQTEVVDFWANFPKLHIRTFVDMLPGIKVLNLGSGAGNDAVLLREFGLDVECVDASLPMVHITQSLGFASFQIEFENLVLMPASFDGVWAYTSLLHISKEEMIDACKKVYNSLVPSGVFFVGMIEGDFDGYKERPTMPGVKRYFRYYQEEDLKSMLLSLGFKFKFVGHYVPAGNHTYMSMIFQK